MRERSLRKYIVIALVVGGTLVATSYGYVVSKALSQLSELRDANDYRKRLNNTHTPNKVVIGSSIAAYPLEHTHQFAYNFGFYGCGYIIGMRYFVAELAVDTLPHLQYALIALNEHSGDGVFFQLQTTHRVKKGDARVGICQFSFNALNNLYPIPDYIPIETNLHAFIRRTLGVMVNKELRRLNIIRYALPLFSLPTFPKKQPHQSRVHPLADKYIRKAIDVLLAHDIEVVLIRLPQRNDKIEIEAHKIEPLAEYMDTLQRDYHQRLTVLDYLHLFGDTQEAFKDGIHIKHVKEKKYAKQFAAIIEQDLQDVPYIKTVRYTPEQHRVTLPREN